VIKDNLSASASSSSVFTTQTGADEIHIVIIPRVTGDFKQALWNAYREYRETLEERKCSKDTQVFSRIYLSDIENQKVTLQNSELFRFLSGGAVSVIEQPPLDQTPIVIHAYHVRGAAAFGRESLNHDPDGWRNGLTLAGKHYRMVWTSSYDGRGAFDSASQTDELLRSCASVHGAYRMNFLDNAIRTWVFVRDVDNHYKGMVDRRRELFEQWGLTRDTRYIASTGIEGKGRNVDTLVSLDALSVGPLQPGQIVRMEALDHLSPTIKYGVTFERGTRLRFGDRSHLYISGTASINHEGKILHEADVRGQTGRTIENIEALLAPHGASLDDMAYVIVYLRDPVDYARIQDILSSRLPENVPVFGLKASVCRPGWLVEMEGVGIVRDDCAYPAFL
jgi:enamine deaminase RidA (YjgF/YER057c/UK114 family)